MDAQTLMVFLSEWQNDYVDQSFDQQQEPHSSTQLLNKSLPFHKRASVEVNHGHVTMDADEGEEYRTTVEVWTEQGDVELAQERSKRPTTARGKVHGHHWSGRGGDGVAEGQVELQNGPRTPLGQPAAEDPQAEAVEEEPQEEDQAEEDGDGDMVGLHLAGDRLTGVQGQCGGNHCHVHFQFSLWVV